MKVLVIEDDRETAEFIARGLREAGCKVAHADNGIDGLFLAREDRNDVLVVDRNLPNLDGLSLVRLLREGGVDTPALFLSAVNGLNDRVEGLEAGGDDYLAKPFAFSELLARLKALHRRNPGIAAPEPLLRVADLTLDRTSHQVTRAGQPIELQPREFMLLEHLMRHAGELVTRTMLYEEVWGFHFEPKTNVIETHMSRLRAKVDRPFDTPLLRTVRGVGYVLGVD